MKSEGKKGFGMTVDAGRTHMQRLPVGVSFRCFDVNGAVQMMRQAKDIPISPHSTSLGE
jgi:hypothetical protein